MIEIEQKVVKKVLQKWKKSINFTNKYNFLVPILSLFVISKDEGGTVRDIDILSFYKNFGEKTNYNVLNYINSRFQLFKTEQLEISKGSRSCILFSEYDWVLPNIIVTSFTGNDDIFNNLDKYEFSDYFLFYPLLLKYTRDSIKSLFYDENSSIKIKMSFVEENLKQKFPLEEKMFFIQEEGVMDYLYGKEKPIDLINKVINKESEFYLFYNQIGKENSFERIENIDDIEKIVNNEYPEINGYPRNLFTFINNMKISYLNLYHFDENKFGENNELRSYKTIATFNYPDYGTFYCHLGGWLI